VQKRRNEAHMYFVRKKKGRKMYIGCKMWCIYLMHVMLTNPNGHITTKKCTITPLFCSEKENEKDVLSAQNVVHLSEAYDAEKI
jgi:hypothetical protein